MNNYLFDIIVIGIGVFVVIYNKPWAKRASKYWMEVHKENIGEIGFRIGGIIAGIIMILLGTWRILSYVINRYLQN